MGQEKKRRFVASMVGIFCATAAALFAERNARVEENNLLSLPCYWPSRATGNQHLNSCQRTLWHSIASDGATLLADGPGVSAVVPAVAAQIAKYIGYPYLESPATQGLYDGIEADPLCPNGAPSVGAVCDLGAQNDSGARQAEVDKNWKSASCGQTARIRIADGKITLDLTPPAGSTLKESAWLLGARIQALKYHFQEVVAELTEGNPETITLRDPTAQTMARDFKTQILDRYRNTFLALGKDLNGKIDCNWNFTEIKARQKELEGTGASVGQVNSNLVSSDSYLCAMRSHMVASFSMILAYEILGRMQTDYTTMMLEFSQIENWKKRIEGQYSDAFKKACETEAGCQAKYDELVKKVMQERFDCLWPLPSSTQARSNFMGEKWNSMEAPGSTPPAARRPSWPLRATRGQRGASCR